MVAAQDEGDRTRARHVEHLAVDHGVTPLQPGRHDGGVTRIDHVEVPPRLHAELQRVVALRVGRRADGPRPEARTGAVADALVERDADDGHVRRASGQGGGILQVVALAERGQAHVARQLDLGDRWIRAIPAVEMGESAGRRLGHGGASHGAWRRRFP